MILNSIFFDPKLAQRRTIHLKFEFTVIQEISVCTKSGVNSLSEARDTLSTRFDMTHEMVIVHVFAICPPFGTLL